MLAMMDKGQLPDGEADSSGENASWYQRQSCYFRHSFLFHLLHIIPMICLAIASLVLGILLAREMNKQKNAATSSAMVCSSENCVAVAGSILASMDKTVDPCTNFYEFSCGGFEHKENIPSGFNKYNSFEKARRLVAKNLRRLLEEKVTAQCDSDARAKARRFYQACIHQEENATPPNGFEAIKRIVNDLGGFALNSLILLPETWSLASLLEKRNTYTLNGFFTIGVVVDIKNRSRNIIKLSQGGLGLGTASRRYYLHENDPTLIAYAEMLRKYAKIITDSNVDAHLVSDVVQFEQEIAKIQIPNSQMRNPSALYNKQNVTWLQANIPFIDWFKFLQSIFKGKAEIGLDEPVIVFGTSYLTNLTAVVEKYLKTPDGRRTLHNYVLFQAIIDYAQSFVGPFQEAYDKFQAIFSGSRGPLPLWERCRALTDKILGFALGAMYVDRYFAPAEKEKVVSLIDRVSGAFKERVRDVNWMDQKTKEHALAKVDALVYEAAYPDWVKDDARLNDYYAKLEVTDDFAKNQFYAYEFSKQKISNDLRAAPVGNIWGMNPQTVNAYYRAESNKFVVPAGILVPPFFYQGHHIPPAINFGAIGSVIGHEISHGLDDRGSQFDKSGNLKNWWTPQTRATFNEKTQCLIDQYSAIRYPDKVNGTLHLNGKQTLGENIGDNGGIRTSYQAYKKAVKTLQKYEDTVFVGMNLTSDQLFFVGFAQLWCSMYTPEARRMQILENNHPPMPSRVNGPLSNSPDFAKAFKCPVDSPMNPSKKCMVW